MVLITAIYAILTYRILRANKESTDIAYKQFEDSRDHLAESVRQFVIVQEHSEDKTRLECLPFIQVELLNEEGKETDFVLDFSSPQNQWEEADLLQKDNFKIRNIGNGTAIDLIYTWERENDQAVVGFPPINAIMCGDTYIVNICFGSLDYLSEEWRGVLTFEFKDLLFNEYTQKMRIIVENSSFPHIENSTPILIGSER